MRSRQAWTNTQWDNVWPRTEDFTFDLANTEVLASADGSMAVAIARGPAPAFAPMAVAFPRPGRANIVLAKQDGRKWVSVHSHMSLQRGVPQDSHGKRAVKSR